MNKINFNELNELRSTTKIKNFDVEYTNFKNKINILLERNPDCKPILIAIVGSTSYGLDLETSDLDGKGVYIQNLDSILSELKLGQTNTLSYKKQINDYGDKTIDGKPKDDITLYELGRYLELVQDNNPNIIELLNTPEDCIVYKDPIWDELIKVLNDSNVLTKKCYYTFHNYASQQIKKATGLNKKINNPVDKIRKTPIDFCSVIFDDNSTIGLRSFLEKNKYDQKLCGLVKIPHARDMYGLYYDEISSQSFSRYLDENTRIQSKEEKVMNNQILGLGYKGIIKENDENQEVSNEIRVSSIPQTEERIAIISYNKDGYMKYCKDYLAYWGNNGWMNMRNEERYNDNVSSGQNYDGKNMSHCVRLLYMAKEIADGKGVIVRRNSVQRDELISIKKGQWAYEDIMSKCELLTNGLEDQYNKSNLPNDVSNETLMKILLDTRKKYYFNNL